MSLKHEFVTLARREGANVRELCRRYTISPPTGYQLLRRYAHEGDAGLAQRSRRPHHSPNRMPAEVEQAVVDVREEHPAWGGRTIRKVLADRGHRPVPSPSTITAILRRNGCTVGGKRPQRDWQRFEHRHPNDLWQIDFKGHFPTSAGRSHPLTVLDDHYRFALRSRGCAKQSTALVRAELSGLLRRWPERWGGC
ncbi:MAG: helix-turn-helix domain-containing protein, partial [Chloroflexi bacterium]|nr:helix-turn-helix domain-containing protein [Chloroflexota bacterium]